MKFLTVVMVSLRVAQVGEDLGQNAKAFERSSSLIDNGGRKRRMLLKVPQLKTR